MKLTFLSWVLISDDINLGILRVEITCHNISNWVLDSRSLGCLHPCRLLKILSHFLVLHVLIEVNLASILLVHLLWLSNHVGVLPCSAYLLSSVGTLEDSFFLLQDRAVRCLKLCCCSHGCAIDHGWPTCCGNVNAIFPRGYRWRLIQSSLFLFQFLGSADALHDSSNINLVCSESSHCRQSLWSIIC